MTYFTDNSRHLICYPYSVENLHKMAEQLGIRRCWFNNGKLPHYDVPKEELEKIKNKCQIVSPKTIVRIIRLALTFNQVKEEVSCPTIKYLV